MFTVYLKDNSTIYKSNFCPWKEAEEWGNLNFGPENYEIIQEWYE